MPRPRSALISRPLARVPLLLTPLVLVLGLGLGLAGCGGTSGSASPRTGSTSSSTPTAASTTPNPVIGPERVALELGAELAPAASTTGGTTVDGIQCAPLEQLAYHIHAHLQVYVDGQPRALPGAIGILGPVAQQTAAGPFFGASKCIYWLHTHTSDGVIHIESPTARIYTLGNFFHEWNQPLSATQVATAHGAVTAIIDGRPWTKPLASLPLRAHASIELAVGKPVPPFVAVNWAPTGL